MSLRKGRRTERDNMSGATATQVLGLCIATVSLAAGLSGCTGSEAREESRVFRFNYSVVVENIPARANRLAVWLPVPQSDRHQIVRDLEVTAPGPYTILREAEYGNSILQLTAESPLPDRLEIQMEAVIERRAYHVLRGGEKSLEPSDSPLPRDLAPNRLVPTDGVIANLASQVTREAGTPLEKARAIYEYVTDSMRYDKTGSGWGRGDALYACEARAGNCTDFHSLIIGMARASGVPARFVMGFPLPDTTGQGNVPGYHCWAELYIEGVGWLPVDSSEASKHPEKRKAFFGGLDANRVQFTRGRDLVIGQHEPDALNYLVYPHVEVDGVPYEGVIRRFSFVDDGAAPRTLD